MAFHRNNVLLHLVVVAVTSYVVSARFLGIPLLYQYETEVEVCLNKTVTAVSCQAVNVSDPLDVLQPHPDDCQLFYYCVQQHSPPVCRQCPAGLHFDPAERVCTYPQDAGCLNTTTV